MTIGGLGGFLLVIGAGMSAGREPFSVLCEASLAAVLGALLVRWLNRVVLRNIHAAVLARRDEVKHGPPPDEPRKAGT